MAKIKKVLLNESPYGARDVVYPQTSYDQIMTKDSVDTNTTIQVFPEITSEYIGKALILSSEGIYTFGEAGFVDDVRVVIGSDGQEISVVDENKIARIRLLDGFIVDSDGNISVDGSPYATAEELDQLREEVEEATSELKEDILDLSSELAAEIARSTSEDNALKTRLDSEEDRLTREIIRSVSEDEELRSLLNSEMDRLDAEILRAQTSESFLRDCITSEILRATNSERYILNLLDDEILRAQNSEQFILNKLNGLDLPLTYLIESTVDCEGNLTYRIPRTIKQEDGKVTISSEGVVLGSASVLDIIQNIDNSELQLQRYIPTAAAVKAYVGNGPLDILIRRGGIVQSEGIHYKANQNTETSFELFVPTRVSELYDNSEYWKIPQIRHELRNYLKKDDSENIFWDDSEHNVIDAINEVYALARNLGDNKQDKLSPMQEGQGIYLQFNSDGVLAKVNVRPTSGPNPTIIVDSSGVKGNYQAGNGIEIVNTNQITAKYDTAFINVTSDGRLTLVYDTPEEWQEFVLPDKSGKRGKALIVDSSGALAWGEAGKIDYVEVDGSESRVVIANKTATIQQIDASIIKGTVESANKALYDSAGNIFTTTYQRIDNMTAGITSEGDKYPSNRAVYNALNLKQDKLTAGDVIDSANLNTNVVSVRYDGRTVMRNSENKLETRNVILTYLNGSPTLVEIIPSDTTRANYIMNLNEVNDKLRDALGNYIGLFTSEGLIPTVGVHKNDYAYVTTKNSEGESFLSRYKCQQPTSESAISWAAEYTISLGKEMLFTTRQALALNSGINEYIVYGYPGTTNPDSEGIIRHMQNHDNPHGVTASQLHLGDFENKSVQQVVSEGLTAALIENKMGDTIITQTRGDARYKKIQTAVTDPTATTGTVISFIDSISQNTQGVITATKKTIPNVSNTQSGLMTPAMKLKLDDIADGATKVTKSNINGNIKINGSEATVYTLPIASSSTLGGVKIGNKINVAADGTISTDGTTYTFTSGTDGSFTVTPADGSPQKVTVLPLTGSEGNGKYLKKNATTGNIEWANGPSGGGGTTPENGKLTINVNNSTIGEFYADQASNTTANIKVPIAGTGLTYVVGSGTNSDKIDHTDSVTALSTIPTTSISNVSYNNTGHITGKVDVTAEKGVQIVSSKIGHVNELASGNSTVGLKAFTYDQYGHINAAATDKTLGRGIDDQSNVIGHSNSITANSTSGLKYFTYDDYGHIASAVNKTLDRGINDQSNVIGHSNTAVSAVTTQSLRKITYDTYGHITGSAVITSEDIEPYVSVQADRGLDVSASKVGHSNTAITTGTLNNNTSTVSDWSTAATYDVIVSQAPYNDYGHITSKTDRTYTVGQSDWDNNTTSTFPYVRNRPNIRLNGHTSGTGMNTTGTVIGNSTNVASGNYSLAEGSGTTAEGLNSHTEGYYTTASGDYSHAEGRYTYAGIIGTSNCAHAEGNYTRAQGDASHTEGWGTITTRPGGHAAGTYNNIDSEGALALNLIHMTGIGDSEGHRVNGMAVTKSGDLRIKGKLYIDCNDDSTGGRAPEGGSSHYGTCVLPVTSEGTITIDTIAFEDGYVLTGEEHPILDLICSVDKDQANDEIMNWAAVYKATVNNNGSITFYLKSEVTSSISVQILC